MAPNASDHEPTAPVNSPVAIPFRHFPPNGTPHPWPCAANGRLCRGGGRRVRPCL